MGDRILQTGLWDMRKLSRNPIGHMRLHNTRDRLERASMLGLDAIEVVDLASRTCNSIIHLRSYS